MKETNRIPYIDIAKGIAILAVIIFHIPVFLKQNGYEFEHIAEAKKMLDPWIVPWFMAIFFFVSGLCTKYDRGGVKFLKKNLTHTLLPALVFSLMTMSIQSIAYKQNKFCSLLSLGYWLYWTQKFWFFPALFVAKELYWFSVKLFKNKWKRLFIILPLFFMGVAFGGRFGNSHNVMYGFQAFAYTLFVFLGDVFKGVDINKSKLRFIALLYPVLVILFNYILGFQARGIMYSFSFNIKDVPLFLPLSISGCLLVLYVSSHIKSSLLSFCGIWSGFIYAMHYVVAEMFLVSFVPNINNRFYAITLYVFLLTAVLGVSYFMIKVLNHEHTKWLVGKF